MSIRHIPSPSDKYIKALEKELAEARQEVERLTADLALASKCWNVDIADLQAERDLSRELAEASRALLSWTNWIREDECPATLRYEKLVEHSKNLAAVLSRYEVKQETKE